MQIRLPWVDPQLVSGEDIADGNVLDLNRDFRGYLLSTGFMRRLTSELSKEIRALDQQQQLQAEQVWRLYRAHRLLNLLDCPLTEGELLDSYLHLLATGQHWYFTNRRAWSYSEDDGQELGDIGRIFERFLREARPPAGELLLQDPAQIPFSRIYSRYLRADAAEPVRIAPTAEIHAPMAPLAETAKFFRKHRDRLLRVTWSPQERITPSIRRFVKQLHDQGIPIALEFTPIYDSPEPDEFIFDAMDELLKLEPYIRQLSIRTTQPELSDLITVQLGAESNHKPVFAPHLIRRVAVSPTSRLTAAKPMIVKSNFDLAAIAIEADPGKDAHPYRLGRGWPKPDSPTFPRQPKTARYMLFAESARAVPMSSEDAAYSEAVAFFQRRRRASEFIREYEPSEHTRVLAFLENLVNLEVLSLS